MNPMKPGGVDLRIHGGLLLKEARQKPCGCEKSKREGLRERTPDFIGMALVLIDERNGEFRYVSSGITREKALRLLPSVMDALKERDAPSLIIPGSIQ